MNNKISTLLVFLFESYKLTVFCLSSLLYLYVVISYIYYYLFPKNILLGREIIDSTNKELSLLFIATFLATSIIFIIDIKRKKLKLNFKTLLTKSKSELVMCLITSFFFAYFFSKSFVILSKLGSILIFVLTLTFFIYIFYLVEFYLNYSLSYFSSFIKENLRQLRYTLVELKKKRKVDQVVPTFSILFRFGVLFVVVLIILGAVVGITGTIEKYLNYQKSLRDNLTIMKVIPTRTTIGEKVFIDGYNFGWKLSKQDNLISRYGPVIVESWQDKQITFVVPLHWKEGRVKIWVERLKDTTKNAPLIRSNKVTLNIVSRWYFYPSESDFSNPFFNYLFTGVKKIRRIFYLRTE